MSDLTSLKGMPLEYVDISDTKVSDLSPLKGMKIHDLNIEGTPAALAAEKAAAGK